MSVSSVTGYSSFSGYSKPGTVDMEKSQEATRSRSAAPAQDNRSVPSGQSSQTGATVVSLSTETLSALSQPGEKAGFSVSYYEQFFPTREGYSARNLAAAIVDPGAQPFSQYRAFAEVAEVARASLDGMYQKMRESGQPYDKDVDWNSLFGELDRRALYAVKSNEGGLFSEDEQKIAYSIMGKQRGLAIGLYHGPSRLRGNYSHPGMLDHVQREKVDIQFLEAVSKDEKASFNWAKSRAVTQWVYEVEMAKRGEVPQDFTSENPLVRLIKAALDTWKDRPGMMGSGGARNEEELRAEPWFKGFEGQLDSAIAKSRELYGVS